MQIPDRLLRVVRPSEHPGLLLATAYGAAVLSVGPFVLPEIAETYDIGVGLASTATAGQLAGFVVGSWGAGRYLRPRGRIVGIALAAALVINAASALLPPLAIFLVLRVVSGVSLGVITWFSWSQVFGNESRMGSIAVIGPVVGITTAPITALLLAGAGLEGVFWALALTAVVPLAFSRRSGSADPELFTTPPPKAERHRATPEAVRVLAALAVFTLGGSSVFTFGAVIAADETTLSLGAVSLAYSANALVAIPSARWTGRRGVPGLWLAVCAACAVVLGLAFSDWAFVVAMTLWGFAFWMGIPGAYSLLARCSRYPEERAGDAQAVMAAGRVVGPLAGGVLIEAGGSALLGLLGGAVMLAAAITLIGVDRASAAPVS